jgi:hypothetical protein
MIFSFCIIADFVKTLFSKFEESFLCDDTSDRQYKSCLHQIDQQISKVEIENVSCL